MPPPDRGAKGADWGGVGMRKGVPLPSRLEDLRCVVSSPSGVRGGSPAGNAFWRILKATERSFWHIYADALSYSNSVPCHIWRQGRGLGTLPLRRTVPAPALSLTQLCSLYT